MKRATGPFITPPNTLSASGFPVRIAFDTTTHRKCGQCGAIYPREIGVGGTCADSTDKLGMPGVRALEWRPDVPNWNAKGYCSDDCYSEAYYEPSYENGGPA